MKSIELKCEDISLFAVASQVNNWDDLLVGHDKEGRVAFMGGKKEEEDVHILETVDREGTEEIGGTIFPENFTSAAYQQHFVFAHSDALPFFTSKSTHKQLLEKDELMDHIGDLKLRIGVRLFEVSGKAPREVKPDEMANPLYRKVSPDEPKMREAVRIMLRLAGETGCWHPSKLIMPDSANPTRFNIKGLRQNLFNMGVGSKTLRRHFYFPADFIFAARKPQVKLQERYAAA